MNGTWELSPRSSNDNVINSLWVFKVKQREDGFVEQLKACLVANGMRQIEASEYHYTFSPVVKQF